jgi:hypothetical protein
MGAPAVGSRASAADPPPGIVLTGVVAWNLTYDQDGEGARLVGCYNHPLS